MNRSLFVSTLFACSFAVSVPTDAWAATYSLTTLASFTSAAGAYLPDQLVLGADGNLYLSTLRTNFPFGTSGAILEIPAGTNEVKYRGIFTYTNGRSPIGELYVDAAGNIFGTTSGGGINSQSTSDGYGVVFEIPAGTNVITPLVNFDVTNGSYPNSRLIADGAGNLYGTTYQGGSNSRGTVFEISAATQQITTLGSFNGANGAYPKYGVVMDSAGNLYGSTDQGGANNKGAIFEIAAGSQSITTLFSFDGTNGRNPSSVIIDANGNLFGTTVSGGANNAGTVFEILADTHEFIALGSFDFPGENAIGFGDLISDPFGNIYGFAASGLIGGGITFEGAIFKIAAGTHTMSIIHTFDEAIDGSYPSSLIVDAQGNLFGTTQYGGPNGRGTIFEIAAGTDTLTTIFTFDGKNGYLPNSLLIGDKGHLYGTTYYGGPNFNINRGSGTVFELTKVVPESNSLALISCALVGAVCLRSIWARRQSRS